MSRPNGRSRGRLPDLLFALVLMITVGVPAVHAALHHSPLAAAGGGTSGGSGGGTSGGSDGGGSGGSNGGTSGTSGNSGGSGGGGTGGGTGGGGTNGGGTGGGSTGGNGGTTGNGGGSTSGNGNGNGNNGSGNNGGGSQTGGGTKTGGGQSVAPNSGATRPAEGSGSGKTNPNANRRESVGDAFVATVESLPPFLPIDCLVGAGGGAKGLEPGIPQAVGDLCADISVDLGSGGSGTSNSDTNVTINQTTRLDITIEAPLPGHTKPHVIVRPDSGDLLDNHLWATLLAILLIFAMVVAIALVLHRRRSS